jgi:hypothetical protein
MHKVDIGGNKDYNVWNGEGGDRCLIIKLLTSTWIIKAWIRTNGLSCSIVWTKENKPKCNIQ